MTVKSTIDACGLPLSAFDLVNVHFQSTGQNVVAYQSQNDQTYCLPTCMKVEKASYFRGKDEKFSISFSGYSNSQQLNINAAPLCLENFGIF